MYVDQNSAQKVIRGDSKAPFKLNKVSMGFFAPAHLIGISLWPLYLAFGGTIQWQEISVFIFMWLLGTIGINFGYHRGFSHRSFKMSPVLKFLTLVGGASVVEGSALVWCADHRRHHRYEDTDKDPYNIKRGFWWAHMGWILGSPTTTDFTNCNDLNKDAMIRNQDKYYIGWLAACCFGIPLILGVFLGRPIESLLLAGLFRLVLFDHATYLINSYSHYFGRRPYSRKITARDSFIAAILTNGEGWHNFHHRFPWDYRNGHRFYHYDITKWMIQLSRMLGLVWDLKEAPKSEIYRAQIEAQKEKARTKASYINMDTLSEAVETALARWNKMGTEWISLKKQLREKRKALKNDFSEAYDQQLRDILKQMDDLKQKTKEAKSQFLRQYAIWKACLKTLPAH